MIERKIELIKILWSGPYTPDQIRNNKKIGLYQIYGTHPIYGRNVLIYIGETTTSFIDRIKAHQNWMQYELDELVFYTGEIQSEEQNNIRYIKEAEKMLLYYTCPAYNSNLISDYMKSKDFDDFEIIIMNFGKIGSLPYEVSTFHYDSEVWDRIY
ncbi:MAG: hypothetical protein A2W91_18330 [Bacteroidetes bacterium GWF2_38_335]|nr:MAG: hypothetical protein A2W91_18330 [Bacteroidetes bacterium GWF2_38_335]OFY80077.1 MAG: hypothetical protein A2281_12305 [Bacteroidetes bacterium RIFOXYA12_FULL_38_20]HBS88598.1 hypothetical protein [Bacteroidales bacterium]